MRIASLQRCCVSLLTAACIATVGADSLFPALVAESNSCTWSETVLTGVDSPWSAAPIYLSATGEINADGEGGGSGWIGISLVGPADSATGKWSVINAAGDTVALGNFSTGRCQHHADVYWSGQGQASNGTLYVMVTANVMGLEDFACDLTGQVGVTGVSSTTGVPTCPYDPTY